MNLELYLIVSLQLGSLDYIPLYIKVQGYGNYGLLLLLLLLKLEHQNMKDPILVDKERLVHVVNMWKSSSQMEHLSYPVGKMYITSESLH